VSWAEVITPEDRELFRRCRRAWDLGSARRRNLVPRAASAPAPDAALRDALAVYYYPGMWQWDRSLVTARAREALESALADAGADALARAIDLLDRYLVWAPSVDRFEPLSVNGEFDVTIPDPRAEGAELASAEGLPIRFRGFVDLLAHDHDRRYWIVAHRIVEQPLEVDALRIDPPGAAACWAWQRCFLAQPIAGIQYNELCRSSGSFRRIAVERTAAERDAAARTLAFEALDMVDDLRVYPNFAWSHCRSCAYQRPCAAIESGEDAEPILAEQYRERAPARRLGATTWSLGRGAAPPAGGSGVAR